MAYNSCKQSCKHTLVQRVQRVQRVLRGTQGAKGYKRSLCKGTNVQILPKVQKATNHANIQVVQRVQRVQTESMRGKRVQMGV